MATLYTSRRTVKIAPTAPAQTTSTSAVFMGLGIDQAGAGANPLIWTPRSTGVIMMSVYGIVETLTGPATATMIGKYGSWRTDTAVVTNGSDSVTDAAILATDSGRLVTGTGIPAQTYVGTVTANTSFLLSSSPTSQVNVNATAPGTSVTLGGYGNGVLLSAGAGTTFGPASVPARSSATAAGNMFLVMDLISNLSLGTTYWFDLTLDTSNATDAAEITSVMAFIQTGISQ